MRTDVGFLDLEDAVAPDQKEAARAALARALERPAPVTAAVRINEPTTPEGLKDILFLLEKRIIPDILIVPKASLATIVLVTEILKSRYPKMSLFIVIETARGLCEFRNAATAPPGVDGIIFGSADFATDMGVDLASANFNHVKQELVLAARRFGIVAIDCPCFVMQDEALLRRECLEAAELGFVGKVAIHPSQVPIINELFSPSVEAVEHARSLLRHDEAPGKHAIRRVGNQMIGPPFLKRARQVLDRARELAAPSGAESK